MSGSSNGFSYNPPHQDYIIQKIRDTYCGFIRDDPDKPGQVGSEDGRDKSGFSSRSDLDKNCSIRNKRYRTLYSTK
ncbi:hypothetical protein GCM10007966_14260 [Legionella impletisoli]|uniref:Uncharacterized protein n=1 Tax=Legionella impletisoli TaxID=343510 RepID=A0A917NCB0_9GAMM|nr:hypothetical protein GCM10007966_14260 [Legionella impletisoli]